MTLQPQEVPIVPKGDSHLENTAELLNDKLAALDGDIGHIRDFYFDDETWVIRYAIADTGAWLSGRIVLLSPHAFGKLDQHQKTLHINLQKAQIENSPSIETHKPVSRQFELDYHTYYGWPPYWSGKGLWGVGGYPGLLPLSPAEVESRRLYHHRDDKHLRSHVSRLSRAGVNCHRNRALARQQVHPDGWEDQDHPQRRRRDRGRSLAAIRLRCAGHLRRNPHASNEVG
jgi:hypothetical protein